MTATPELRSRTRRKSALNLVLIEDDPGHADLVLEFLQCSERFDVGVRVCSTVAEARTTLAEERFDIILLDYRLGDGDGIELLAGLAAQGAPGCPVMFLTGLDPLYIEDEAFELGAAGCLSKDDLNAGILDSAISAALRHHRDVARARQSVDTVLAALHDRTVMMGNLAHEVGNLASAARAVRALRERGTVPRDGRGYEELIGEYIDQLYDTARAMLDEVTGDVHREGVRCYDARQLAAKIARFCAPLFEGRENGGRKLHVTGPQGPVFVRTDAVLLVQIALNLVSNAAKYSPPEGCVEVELAVAGPELRISVSDEGEGMSAEELHALRQRGRRGDPEAAEGHGFGLAIVDEFLDRLGGRLEIESARSRGTTMRAIIPLSTERP